MGTNLRLLAVLVTASITGLVFAAAASADAVRSSNEAVAVSASLSYAGSEGGGDNGDNENDNNGKSVKDNHGNGDNNDNNGNNDKGDKGNKGKIFAAASVTNITRAKEWVHIYVFSDWQFAAAPNLDVLVQLRPGHGWDWSKSFKTRLFTPPGLYHLTLITDSPGLIDSLVAEASIVVL